MRTKVYVSTLVVILLMCSFVSADESILIQFQKANIWKVDRPNHRCLVDRGVWDLMPLDKKEQILQVIYVEEKTWWRIYDYMSGKLLGEVSSWGWKIHP